MSVIGQEDIAQPSVMPTSQGGSAVGVPSRKWFVAVVKNNTELTCREKLEKRGFEAYVPTQEFVAVDSKGRRKIVTKILIPAKILLHVTEIERREIVEYPYIIRYLTDRCKCADKYGNHPIATIPDEQIEQLKYVLFHTESPILFEMTNFNQGDKFRVARGCLNGITGYLTNIQAERVFLCVNFGSLGVAKIVVKISDLEKIYESRR